MLYQLSYFRIVMNLFGEKCDEDGTRTHTSQLTLPPQSSASTNSATSPFHKRLCPEQDSNLHASRHTHLKRARLPIPPPGHCITYSFLSESFQRTRASFSNAVAKVLLFFELANFSETNLQFSAFFKEKEPQNRLYPTEKRPSIRTGCRCPPPSQSILSR